MAKTREPVIGGRLRSSRAALPPTAPGQSRLAHWPPPYRGKENKPVIMTHQPGEAPKRAKPRGWRLTRALFSEFADD